MTLCALFYRRAGAASSAVRRALHSLWYVREIHGQAVLGSSKRLSSCRSEANSSRGKPRHTMLKWYRFVFFPLSNNCVSAILNYSKTTRKRTVYRRFGFASEAFIRTDFWCRSSVCNRTVYRACWSTVISRAVQFRKDGIQFDVLLTQFDSTCIANMLRRSYATHLVRHLRAVKVWSVLFSDIFYTFQLELTVK